MAGQRYKLIDGKKFALINSGRVEVYAMTRDVEKFRQVCLMEVFPALDELIDVVIIEIIGLNEISVDLWFAELVKLQWLKTLADRGDEMLLEWREGSLFSSCKDFENLYLQFLEHEQIFSMLTMLQFKQEDKRFTERLKKLVQSSINRLIGEYEKLNETVLESLSMNTENITIAAEFVKRLDQVGIIRRLVQKGNMQMRFVTFEGDWYKRDSGVILAAFIPVEPQRYSLVTEENPRGVEITDEVAAKIQNRGLPAKKLTVADLIKFIGQHIWANDCKAILGASFIAGYVATMSPIITETIFTDIIPILDRQGLVTVTQVAIVVACTTAIVSAVRSVAMLRIMTHVDSAIESALLGRLFALPAKLSGEIAARLMGILEVKSVFGGSLIPAVFDLVFSVWSLLLMGYYSLKFTALALLFNGVDI